LDTWEAAGDRKKSEIGFHRPVYIGGGRLNVGTGVLDYQGSGYAFSIRGRVRYPPPAGSARPYTPHKKSGPAGRIYQERGGSPSDWRQFDLPRSESLWKLAASAIRIRRRLYSRPENYRREKIPRQLRQYEAYRVITVIARKL
jgi:hypothetical protein